MKKKMKTFKISFHPSLCPWMKPRFEALDVATGERHTALTALDAIKAFVTRAYVAEREALLVGAKRRIFTPSLKWDAMVIVSRCIKQEYHEYRFAWETPACPGYYENSEISIDNLDKAVMDLHKDDNILVDADIAYSITNIDAPRTNKEWKKTASSFFTCDFEAKEWLVKNPW